MKRTFKEYYRIDDAEAKRIWKEGIIVVDTNILLNLYRYSKDTSDDVFKVLKSVKERLWLPYQACYEFHENRLNTYYDSWNAAGSIKKMLNNHVDKFTNEVKEKFSRNPFVDIDELDKVVKRSIARINTKLDEWKNSVTDFVNDDKILDEITTLFDGKVGLDYDEEKLKAIYKEGEARYKIKCPPGFKDDTAQKRADGPRHVYGDLILWKQLMEHAKEKKKDVVFISDDQKEDWWVEWKGMKIYPKPELIREFEKETDGRRVVFYNQQQFLNFAQPYLKDKTKESTIKEVEAVSSAQNAKASIVIGNKTFYGGDISQHVLGLSQKDNDSLELMALSGLTGTHPLSGITASQEILQSALHISELAKPFAGLTKNPSDSIWTTPDPNKIVFDSLQSPQSYLVSPIDSNPPYSSIYGFEKPEINPLASSTYVVDKQKAEKNSDDKSSK